MRNSLLLSAVGFIFCSFFMGTYEAKGGHCSIAPYDRYSNPYNDRYAYRYRQPCYYPYYNSGYWKPTSVLRKRPRIHYGIPRYYPAWGYPSPSALSRRWARH